MSVGGWNYSPQFHSVVLSATARAKFAQSAVKLLEDYGLDGIDVDYEYPGNDDEARGYAQLLAALRVALDNHAASKGTNHRFLITVSVSYHESMRIGVNNLVAQVAAPGGPYQYNLLHIPEMNESLDFWNLMAYDMGKHDIIHSVALILTLWFSWSLGPCLWSPGSYIWRLRHRLCRTSTLS
jgi:chitinase